ncbi:ATP-binding protein [Endozoicomonas acroporae]|uniref:ATP-binding protein n=1 Tax=Endozoicomonas acroporae TaxID=1701104 RepID=UPI001C60AB8D
MRKEPLLIQQVANLIENALRYCPTGSRITLGCGLDKEDGIAWLKVADNGPGIVDEEKERVFERLYRVDKSRTDGGLGLGLSLAV